MVALPEVKNVADFPEGGGGVLIPAGQYKAVIVKSEMVETKAKDGHYLALTVVITEGAHKDTEFIERLNIVNKNPKAVKNAYKTLASISRAFGMKQTPSDSNELHNKPIMIEIKNKKGKDWVNNDGQTVEGTEQSEIKKYLAVPAGGVATSPAPETTEAPAEKAEASPPASNPFAK